MIGASSMEEDLWPDLEPGIAGGPSESKPPGNLPMLRLWHLAAGIALTAAVLAVVRLLPPGLRTALAAWAGLVTLSGASLWLSGRWVGTLESRGWDSMSIAYVTARFVQAVSLLLFLIFAVAAPMIFGLVLFDL